VEVQATAEGRPYSASDLTRFIEVARPAIEKLVGLQKSILKHEPTGKQKG